MKMVSNVCCSLAFSLAVLTLCAALLLGDSALASKFHSEDLTIDLSRYTTASTAYADSHCDRHPHRHADSVCDSHRYADPHRDRHPHRHSDSVCDFDRPRCGCRHFISIFFRLAFAFRGAVVVVLLVLLVWVLRTLRSVEASVHHLLATHNHGRELRVEVVVVDDASTDNTAMKVAGFVEERRRKGVTNPEWKLVAVQHNLKVGAARNLGVQASTGDVVFFCDSDDLYLENHVFTCFERLERESKAVSVTLGIEIDAENVDREWAVSIGQTLPMSTCMLRTFYDLIEGFPEGYYWVLHEDVAFLSLRRHAASLLGAQTINDITKLTSKYMRYPGNALDRQLEGFQKPMSEKSGEELRNTEPFMRLKELILSSHDKYLQAQKIPAALAGKPLNEWDNYWAVYQSLIRKEMRTNNSTYAAELRVAPLKSWRLSHLHTLATVLDQRGNGTYARLVRDLARTVTPTPLDLEDDTVNYHEISTSSSA